MTYRPPPGAIDTHAHVFGPASRYPYTPDRSYTPDDATPQAYLALLDALGLDYGVIVQPTPYGTDNRRTLDAAAAHPKRLRAVVAVHPDVPVDTLEEMHAKGARGTRVSNVARGGVPLESAEAVARRVKHLGWHLLVMANRIELVTAMKPILERLPVPVMIDHVAMMKVAQGLQTQGFRDLLELVRGGNTWVKISHAYGITAAGAPYEDLGPLVQELLAADPTRLLWGSDWPHPSHRDHPPDDRVLLDAFAGWVPDEADRKLILVDNPARFYDFG